MNLNGKTYLLTGGAGFVGSHLGNRLEQLGAHVKGLDNYLHPVGAPPTFKIERADVRDFEYLAISMKNCDAVIHLAAAINIDWGQTFPELAWEINVDGTRNVLEVARRFDIPVIYASSSEIYGSVQHICGLPQSCIDEGECENVECRTMTEYHPLDGQSVYSASKIAGDRLCRAYTIEQGMDINVVRSFNIFGLYQGDDSYGGVISKFTKAALNNKPMTIYGNGESRRDYTWYEDAVNAYLLALTTKFNGPVNFGTGTTISINELSTDIAHLVYGHAGDAWHATVAEHVAPRKGEVDCLRCDASKARAMGWEPKTTFQEGLERYVEWAKRQ